MIIIIIIIIKIKTIKIILIIIKVVVVHGYTPSIWQAGAIIPLFKSGSLINHH